MYVASVVTCHIPPIPSESELKFGHALHAASASLGVTFYCFQPETFDHIRVVVRRFGQDSTEIGVVDE